LLITTAPPTYQRDGFPFIAHLLSENGRKSFGANTPEEAEALARKEATEWKKIITFSSSQF
jgi:hypothetical protein